MKTDASLTHKTASFAGGTIIFMVGQLVFVTLLARLGDPLLVGAYTLATAILNPVFYLSRMGMRMAQATEPSDGFAFGTYQCLRYGLLSVAVMVTVIVERYLDQPRLVGFVIYVILTAKVIESLADLKYGLFLRNDLHHAIATSLTLRALASLLCFVLLYAAFDAATAVMALPITWSLVYWLHDSRLAHPTLAKLKEPRKTSISDVCALLTLLLPLAFAGFLGQLGTSVPRYIIGLGIGTEILGQLAPALMLHVFVGAFADSIAQALLPSVARKFGHEKNSATWYRIRSIAFKLLPLVLFGIAFSFICGRWLIDLVFGAEYELAGKYLGIISLSWSFRAYGTLFESIILGERRFLKMLQIHTLGFLLYTVSSLTLWLHFGLVGAVWGISLGSMLYCCVMLFSTWKGQHNLAPS